MPLDDKHLELDELIAAGWGSVPRRLIPPDWRTRRPPNTSFYWHLESLSQTARNGYANGKAAYEALQEKPEGSATWWVRFEHHQRFHAVYFRETYAVTWCGRAVEPEKVRGETDKPPAKCDCCTKRMKRPYLVPIALRLRKEKAEAAHG